MMVAKGPRFSESDRAALLRIAASRQTPQGVATRARAVIDCADLGIAEAARRSSVSRTTAARWWQRYLDAGVEGLRDVSPAGRPPAPDEVVHRVLSCSLDDPPGGRQRWSTRAIAEVTGVSQATVSRIRRHYFPPLQPGAAVLQDFSTSVLDYVDVHRSGCALGFLASNEASPRRTPPAVRLDIVETVICAALLRLPSRGQAETVDDAPDAVTLLERAVERLPSTPAVTLVVNAKLDAAARRWLSRHPEITAHAVTGTDWFGLLHSVADAIDPRQLAELREVQQHIRHARRDGADEFVWCRAVTPPAPVATRTASDAETEPPAGNFTHVIRGICTAVAEGEVQPGDTISAHHIARKCGVSPGRVADTLAQLAEEALVDKHAGRYLLPVPTPRDVIETYTARSLLGTVITRRLASTRIELPPVVDEYFAGLVRCDELGRVYEAGDLDLDLQDELATTAAMPRIGSMFIRLTLQLRLFVTIFGLNYRYPTDEIIRDDRRILDEIRRRDLDGAVSAWHSKIDNCARFMLTHLRPIQ
ncbi:helix-turn-helix domain-containing protein [Mycobacterium sp. 155]|uniref:helix-turn-helix domain-containing protein n=1 Tax=Mycobacterium sp. 155 TaxID=1157943 RepID=UPI00037A63BB|nr:helix-turn-helix domain-containing protein [Mycobacterium sp. 155]